MVFMVFILILSSVFMTMKSSFACDLDQTNASNSDASGDQVAFITKWHDLSVKYEIEYGLPWEGVIAQAILESGTGTSTFARERNNFFGIHAFDADPNQALSFPTPEAGWKGYYDFIAANHRYAENGAFDRSGDPVGYIRALKAAGYATSPTYVEDNAKIIGAVTKVAIDHGWANSSDVYRSNKATIDANVAKYKQGVTDNGDANDPKACVATAVNGSIAEVAVTMGKWGADFQACYVWGGGHGQSQAWADEAVNHHFQGAYGVDCSGFVSIVVYKATGTYAMEATQGMCDDTKNYRQINNADVKPGDLAIRCENATGHVEVVTKVENGKVTETVGSHAPGCGPNYGASPGAFTVESGAEKYLRYIGPGAG
jgi:cell wall-associated NlpC family hydrolase